MSSATKSTNEQERRGEVLEVTRELLADGRSEDLLSLVTQLVDQNHELATRAAVATTRAAELEKQLARIQTRYKKNEAVSKAQLVLLLGALALGEAGDVPDTRKSKHPIEKNSTSTGRISARRSLGVASRAEMMRTVTWCMYSVMRKSFVVRNLDWSAKTDGQANAVILRPSWQRLPRSRGARSGPPNPPDARRAWQWGGSKAGAAGPKSNDYF